MNATEQRQKDLTQKNGNEISHLSAPNISAILPLRLRRVSSDDDRRAIVRAQGAAKDGRTIAPTHVIERSGQVVGYFSLNAIPLLTGWMHKELVSDDEATALFASIENEAAQAGLNFLCAPCTPDCRFKDRMEDLGYHQAGEATLNLKAL